MISPTLGNHCILQPCLQMAMGQPVNWLYDTTTLVTLVLGMIT